jgi:hypothetical protein
MSDILRRFEDLVRQDEAEFGELRGRVKGLHEELASLERALLVVTVRMEARTEMLESLRGEQVQPERPTRRPRRPGRWEGKPEPEDRQREIVRVLREGGPMKDVQLYEQVSASGQDFSMDTLRRDLATLGNVGAVVRREDGLYVTADRPEPT